MSETEVWQRQMEWVYWNEQGARGQAKTKLERRQTRWVYWNEQGARGRAKTKLERQRSRRQQQIVQTKVDRKLKTKVELIWKVMAQETAMGR